MEISELGMCSIMEDLTRNLPTELYKFLKQRIRFTGDLQVFGSVTLSSDSSVFATFLGTTLFGQDNTTTGNGEPGIKQGDKELDKADDELSVKDEQTALPGVDGEIFQVNKDVKLRLDNGDVAVELISWFVQYIGVLQNSKAYGFDGHLNFYAENINTKFYFNRDYSDADSELNATIISSYQPCEKVIINDNLEVEKRTATPKIEQKSSSTQVETPTLAEKSVQVPEIGTLNELKSTQIEELEKPVKSTAVVAQSPSSESKEAQRSAKKSLVSESSPVKEEAQVAKARKTGGKTATEESSPTIDGLPAKKSRMLRGKASAEAERPSPALVEVTPSRPIRKARQNHKFLSSPQKIPKEQSSNKSPKKQPVPENRIPELPVIGQVPDTRRRGRKKSEASEPLKGTDVETPAKQGVRPTRGSAKKNADESDVSETLGGANSTPLTRSTRKRRRSSSPSLSTNQKAASGDGGSATVRLRSEDTRTNPVVGIAGKEPVENKEEKRDEAPEKNRKPEVVGGCKNVELTSKGDGDDDNEDDEKDDESDVDKATIPDDDQDEDENIEWLPDAREVATPKSFRNRRVGKEMAETSGNGEQSVTCKVCGDLWLKKDVWRHLKRHKLLNEIPQEMGEVLLEGVREEEVMCQHCFRIVQKRSIGRHLKTHNIDLKKVKVRDDGLETVKVNEDDLEKGKVTEDDSMKGDEIYGIAPLEGDRDNDNDEKKDFGAEVKTEMSEEMSEGPTAVAAITESQNDSAGLTTRRTAQSRHCSICIRLIKGCWKRHQVIHHGADLSTLDLDPATFKKRCNVCNMLFPDMILLRHHKKQQGHFMTAKIPAKGSSSNPDDEATSAVEGSHEGSSGVTGKLDGELEDGLVKILPVPDLSESYTTMLKTVPNPTWEAFQKNYKLFREGKCKEPPREGKERLQCLVCMNVFKNAPAARQHVANMHLKLKRFECLVCGKQKYLRGAMTQHVQTHTGEKPYECTLCDRNFRMPMAVQTHMEKDHGLPVKYPKNEKPCICDACGLVLPSKQALYAHRLFVHEAKYHECDECGKRIKSKNALKKHKLYVHARKLTNVCELCGKGFRYTSSYKKHLASHKGLKPHKCNLCDSAFSSIQNLKIHMDRHKGVKQHKCDICDKEFFAPSGLFNHKKSHSDERAYKCPDCPKTFKRTGGLKTHMVTHTKDYKFPCRICGRKFSQQGIRDTHEKRHTGEKPYSCGVCDKGFVTPGDCRRHEATHNRVKMPTRGRGRHRTEIPEEMVLESFPSDDPHGVIVGIEQTEEEVVMETDQAIGEVLYLMSMQGNTNVVTITQ